MFAWITRATVARTLLALLVLTLASGLSSCGGCPAVTQKPAPVGAAEPASEPAAEPAPAPEPKRAFQDVPAERWKLADLYPSDTAWKEAAKKVQADMPALEAFAGRLGRNARTLADALEKYSAIEKELGRLYSYGGQRFDENTRDPKGLEMQQTIGLVGTEFSQKASFIEPEILAMGENKVQAFVKREPRLALYKHFLDNTLRLKPHTLDKKGEKLVAATGLMAGAASTLYSVLANSDVPWPTITLSDGTEARLDQAGYTRFRSSTNRDDRLAVFTAFWKKWSEYEQTMGTALNAQLKKDLFYTQARNYPTCLARALSANKVPEEVYHMLIKTTNDNIGTLHRYLRLRKRMLGIEELGYHDSYPPLVATDRVYPIAEGKQLVLGALAPLGDEYVSAVEHGFANRWMDTYPREGKRAGAYSNGAAYDVHPYVLMNYNEDYESVSTLAHEWGHTVHSYLANKNQPYPTADYSIFVAEVASTFNEGLLLDRVLKEAKTDEEKLFYLGSALESLRQTYFRQTMFAEFELAIHKLVEKGEALTGKRLTEIYKAILRRYHGHDKGVMKIDDMHGIEWAYIPHFYYNFYVYQYATSLAASSLFVQDVLDGKQGATERYLNLLKAGGSGYPYELLKEAGVDLATPAPYEALMARTNRIMDQIEEILNRK